MLFWPQVWPFSDNPALQSNYHPETACKSSLRDTQKPAARLFFILSAVRLNLLKRKSIEQSLHHYEILLPVACSLFEELLVATDSSSLDTGELSDCLLSIVLYLQCRFVDVQKDFLRCNNIQLCLK